MAWVYLNQAAVNLEQVTYLFKHAGGSGGAIHFTGGPPLTISASDWGMIENALEVLQPTVETKPKTPPHERQSLAEMSRRAMA